MPILPSHLGEIGGQLGLLWGGHGEVGAWLGILRTACVVVLSPFHPHHAPHSQVSSLAQVELPEALGWDVPSCMGIRLPKVSCVGLGTIPMAWGHTCPCSHMGYTVLKVSRRVLVGLAQQHRSLAPTAG